MPGQNARLTFLHLIEQRGGEWSWYQFERAFPPGWFADEPSATRAKEILDRLESDGLVTTIGDGPQPRYRLTEQGIDALREGILGSASA